MKYCILSVPIRLEGGPNNSSGRVTIYYNGEWGTVCDDNFGLEEAHVVCQSLGYLYVPYLFF